MQAVSVQVGGMRSVYAVDMAADVPVGALLVTCDLLDRFGMGRNKAGRYSAFFSRRLPGLRADILGDVWWEVEEIGYRPHRDLAMVHSKQIPHTDPQFTIVAYSHSRPRADPVEAEQGRIRVAW